VSDPESFGSGDKAGIKSRIAVKNAEWDSEAKEQKDGFWDFEAYGKTADFIAEWFSKGQQIIIEGELRNQRFKTKEGEMVVKTVVRVRNANFSGKKEDKSATPEPVVVKKPSSRKEQESGEPVFAD
jgi:single-strand DNA-binding protein